jgi:nucleotide-binding universal stress UspA family protein
MDLSMFQHILVPTDGSPRSDAAARDAVALARSLGGRVTALTVKPEFHVFTLRPSEIEDTKGDSWDVDLHARNFLAVVEDAAREAGCDAIAIATHGRSGVVELLLGSQTQRVLAHAKVPVIVYR